MTIKHFFLVAMLLCCFSFVSYGQYEFLKSEGPIPREITSSSFGKYEKNKKQIDKDISKREKKDRDKFYLEDATVIDRLLRGGKILFNDEVSKYINDVGQILIKGDDKLQRKLKFYAVRSAAVNAFATDRGAIFVNVGLLARLENEAELAFILAHEIEHYVEKHALNLFIESQAISRENRTRRSLYEPRDNDKALLEKNHYSRELEIEADTKGLERFLKTNYHIDAVEDAFVILRDADLPSSNIAFDKSFFETKEVQFPDDYQWKKIKEKIVEEKDSTDTGIQKLKIKKPRVIVIGDQNSSSTHPSISERIRKANQRLQKVAAENRVNFIVSEERFQKIKTRCQYELPQYGLRNLRYYSSIYDAFVLLQKEAYHPYLKKSIAKALYGLAKFRLYELKKNNKEEEEEEDNSPQEEIDEDANVAQEGIKSLVYFLKKLTDEEFSLFALQYIQQLNKELGEDAVLEQMSENLAKDIVIYLPDLATMWSANKQSYDGKSAYVKTMLSKQTKNETSTKFWKKCETDAKEEIEFNDWVDGLSYKERKKIRKKRDKKGYTLGYNRAIVIDPITIYHKKGNRPAHRANYQATEEAQKEYLERAEMIAKKMGLRLKMLSADKIRKKNIETFNELANVKEWLSHVVLLNDLNMIPFNQEQINLMMEKYKTEAFVWYGIKARRKIDGRKANLHYVFGLLEVFFCPPMVIHDILDRDGVTLFYGLVINGKTGKIEMVQEEFFKVSNQREIINGNFYDFFWQIKQKAK